MIFLDIKMEGLSGIGFGKILRNDKKDEDTRIVYISSFKEYVMELHIKIYITLRVEIAYLLYIQY